MELKNKILKIIPLDVRQMALLCESRERLDEALGLAPSREVRDEHLEAAYAQMRDTCAEHEKEYRWYTNWQIVLRKENRAIGSIGFFGAPNAKGEVEVGYGIDEEYRSNGYASEALKLLCEWAFDNGAFFIGAQTEEDNSASKRVLEKCGFKSVGEGDEGILYELEKPASAYLSIYMCLGMSVGMCFGLCFDNMALGMCFGIAIGAALGSSLDAQDRKKRKRE